MFAAVLAVVVGLMVAGIVHLVHRSRQVSSQPHVSGQLPKTLQPMTRLSPRPGTQKPSTQVVRGLGGFGEQAAGRKVVALTFDDGPGPETPQVARALRKAGVRATFFMIGEQAAQRPRMVRRLHADGMSVQTHTQHHANLADLSRSRLRKELIPATKHVSIITGERVRCLRPPYNAWSSRSRTTASRLGLHTVSYNVDSRDWAQDQTAASITRRVVRHVQPGSIILLHDGGRRRTDTVNAIPTMVAKLRQHGYRFTLICQLQLVRNLVATRSVLTVDGECGVGSGASAMLVDPLVAC